MGGLAAGLNGLTRGLNTGLRFAAFQEDKRARREQQARQQEQDRIAHERHRVWMENAALQQRISGLKLQDAQDERERRDALSALTLVDQLYTLEGEGEVDWNRAADSIGALIDPLVDDDPRRDGSGHRVSNLMRTDEGIAIELEVDEQGQKRNAPLTLRRSADPDDPVLVLPYTAVFGTIKRIEDHYRQLGFDLSDPQIRRQVIDTARIAYGDMSPAEARQKLEADKRSAEREIRRFEERQRITNDAKIDLERRLHALRKELGGDDVAKSQSQKLQHVGWLQANYTVPDGQGGERPVSPTEAWDIASRAAADPLSFVFKHAEMRWKAQQEAGRRVPEEERKSLDEFLEEGVRAYAQSLLNVQGVQAGPAVSTVPPPGGAVQGRVPGPLSAPMPMQGEQSAPPPPQAVPQQAPAGAGEAFDEDSFLDQFGVPPR